MRDGFGRTIDYLRISVTERCNLRCTYCIPEATRFEGAEDVLLPDELATVARAAVSLGFRKIRLTGGEPTVRPDIVQVVARIAAALPDGADLSMTTNGVALPRLARPLREAGLRRVNVHLDTLRPDGLPRLMRRGRVDAARAGIAAAEAAGLLPIKLNVVVVRGSNDRDVVDLARLTLEHDWHVRFIELMPLGAGECASVARAGFVSSAETKARIEEALGPLARLPGAESDEARNHAAPGARGVIGFISPVSAPYCGGCNRMRLTADGRFHLCLLRDEELSIRSALRDGPGPAREERVRRLLARAIAAKPAGHRLEEGLTTRGRMMHAIGG